MKTKRKQIEFVSQRQMATCHDCGKPVLYREHWITRPEVWAESGMKPNGGCLHQACLEERLGRKLVEADFLVIVKGDIKTTGVMKLEIMDKAAYSAFNVAMGYWKTDRHISYKHFFICPEDLP